MPNPKYLTTEGKPTVELLKKLSLVKDVYLGNLGKFCHKYFLNEEDFKDIRNVFLIGSHAEENSWDDEQSDLDLKIVNPSAIPEYLWKYKKEVLNSKLCVGEKKSWIDLFFASKEYQVLPPRWELIDYWNKSYRQI